MKYIALTFHATGIDGSRIFKLNPFIYTIDSNWLEMKQEETIKFIDDNDQLIDFKYPIECEAICVGLVIDMENDIISNVNNLIE